MLEQLRQEIGSKRDNARAELREVGDLLSLFSSLGWRVLTERLKVREANKVAEMLEADPNDVARLQGRISELREILGWPDAFRRRMTDLEAKLKGQDKALERIRK